MKLVASKIKKINIQVKIIDISLIELFNIFNTSNMALPFGQYCKMNNIGHKLIIMVNYILNNL